ncbi:MAG TPA: hypothetical protein DIT25_01340 [Candidatus Moranbacteria bacterium]|nr:hypothetical protein [Candidatus Moranbacteria bacterium]
MVLSDQGKMIIGTFMPDYVLKAFTVAWEKARTRFQQVGYEIDLRGEKSWPCGSFVISKEALQALIIPVPVFDKFYPQKIAMLLLGEIELRSQYATMFVLDDENIQLTAEERKEIQECIHNTGALYAWLKDFKNPFVSE